MKKKVNVLLKILTYTNVIALTMLAEVGACTNYFSQNFQNICSKLQWNLADLFFFLQCYENFYVYNTNNIPSICWFLKKVPNVSVTTCYSLSKLIYLPLPNVHLIFVLSSASLLS